MATALTSFPNVVWERNTSTTLLCGAEVKVSDWLYN